ncbi:MAG: sigma-54-dependent transcriptional regulator [Planctomycetota bacterium]|jgi:DNA-binding NtrC family response regulator
MASKRPSVVIIDDEEGLREQLRDFMKRLSYDVRDYGNPIDGLDALRADPAQIVLLDIRMPHMDGMDVLKVLRKESPDIAVIMVSGHGTMEVAIDALRLGAADFLQKPVDLKQLEATLERCIRKSEAKKRDNVSTDTPSTVMVAESAMAKDVRRHLRLVADSPCQSLLITGETGTGKEVAAHLFHEFRHMSPKPFVAENCPSLPDTLIESELFGHVRGAFTGASQDRKGAFEQADGGTLFLDEVGDLTPIAQAKLLRVLETRVVRRVGCTKDRPVNVTVVAATNRSLAADVEAGRFRQDLFFRLNSFAVHLNPLRNRPEDILPLAEHFLSLFALLKGGEPPQLSSSAREALCAYHYPGNARELRNMVERACIMSGGKMIHRKDLFFACKQGILLHTEPPLTPVESDEESGEARQTRIALDESAWNRRKAARRLGISYDALRWRIRKYGLTESESS